MKVHTNTDNNEVSSSMLFNKTAASNIKKSYRSGQGKNFKIDIESIHYTNLQLLKSFITKGQGRILSSRLTNLPPKHQRKLAREIKRARILGLLPFASPVL
jgi:small subunit ribosomal protein S18